MTVLIRLFYEYFLIGLFSVGGGLATVPFLQDLAIRTGWLTLAELADMIAVSQSVPGPIGVNLATYVGFKIAGIPGVIAAVGGIVTPSVAVILIITRILLKFKDSKYVAWAFNGLRPASCALIAAAGVGMAQLSFWSDGAFSIKALLLLAVLIPPMIKTKLHPLIFIAFSAVIGVIFKF
ncbi:MAG: chromate transporter [Oscillospiraceae bacterium]|jgi:chromate transporter|nr:chromate transporter [Oscillospiraceae bacterium]